ncbi:UNVERIFIED_ORG: hypothetical protein CLV66_108126 [Actinomadura viridilutea]
MRQAAVPSLGRRLPNVPPGPRRRRRAVRGRGPATRRTVRRPPVRPPSHPQWPRGIPPRSLSRQPLWSPAAPGAMGVSTTRVATLSPGRRVLRVLRGLHCRGRPIPGRLPLASRTARRRPPHPPSHPPWPLSLPLRSLSLSVRRLGLSRQPNRPAWSLAARGAVRALMTRAALFPRRRVLGAALRGPRRRRKAIRGGLLVARRGGPHPPGLSTRPLRLLQGPNRPVRSPVAPRGRRPLAVTAVVHERAAPPHQPMRRTGAKPSAAPGVGSERSGEAKAADGRRGVGAGRPSVASHPVSHGDRARTRRPPVQGATRRRKTGRRRGRGRFACGC